MSADYDIIIVGAGPAGATLARALPAGLKVLLVDRRRLCGGTPSAGDPPAGRGKACGGLIAPDAQKMLAHMGLGIPQSVLVGPQVFTVRAIDCVSGLERYYQRNYINVDRAALDVHMASLVPPQVELRDRTRVLSARETAEAVEVTTVDSTGRRVTKRGHILVGADGAHSLVRRLLVDRGPQRPRRYISFQDEFVVGNPEPHFIVLFDNPLTDYYAWAIPKGESLLVGSAVPPGRDAGGRHDALVEKLRGYGYRLGRRVRREGAYIERPQRHGDMCAGRGRVILVGEAGGLISPSSAEGLSYAFRSALAAAQALERALGAAGGAVGSAADGGTPQAVLAAYRAGIGRMRRELAAKAAKSLVMYTPALRRLVMSLGIMSMTVRPRIEARAPA